ncbi:hypothetical protein CR513_37774, partial [Mucuna pruriens]
MLRMVTMFIDALPAPYYDRVVQNATSSFIDLVVVGERIKLGIRAYHQAVLELEAQGQGPSGRRSTRTPRPRVEYARQPSPGHKGVVT